MSGASVVIVAIVIVVVAFALMSIRVVREYQRIVLFRLGRCVGERGPGVVLLLPIADRPVMADLRELYQEIPHQACITKDNATISIDFIIYRRVMDPVASVIQVGNFVGAAQQLAATTLRAIIGDIPLDDVLAKREQINEVMRSKLDAVTERWGVKITTVEIREIIPPRDIQDAMTRQMSAERLRRATVTEAEGKRQALVTVAEGEKQSSILQAEGARQSTILRAEGSRQAAVLQAEGLALALEKISASARGIDSKTMALQYLDAFRALGAASSTKLVVPMEITSLIRPLSDLIARASDGVPASTE